MKKYNKVELSMMNMQVSTVIAASSTVAVGTSNNPVSGTSSEHVEAGARGGQAAGLDLI